MRKGSRSSNALEDVALYIGGLPPACLFFIMGLSHFTHTDIFVALMPPYMPFQSFFVYCAGILQICGSLGLAALPFFDSEHASLCCYGLMALVGCMLPANIHTYTNDVPLAGIRLEYSWGGHGLQFSFLLVLLMWLAVLARTHRGRPPLREQLFRFVQQCCTAGIYFLFPHSLSQRPSTPIGMFAGTSRQGDGAA
jgi:uncharacterized membrane protein